jgi:hypothetical protein
VWNTLFLHTIFAVMCVVENLYDASGIAVFIIGTDTNISKKKKKTGEEQQLHDGKKHYKLYIDIK